MSGRIDVAVVDYGTPQLAARCVGSLQSDLFASIELVDAKGRGWSYARSVNTSLERGRAPYVLALNADTRMLEPPDPIVWIFEQFPDVAVVGPRQIDGQGRITHAGIVGSNQRPEHRFWMHQGAYVAGEAMLDCVTVSGSVYFARREVWEQLGGFLETPGYYEETWFSYLARHHGHRVVYTGTVTWEHLWHQCGMGELDGKGVVHTSRELFRAACAREGIVCD
jgi:GT2 family glycosyltransferase